MNFDTIDYLRDGTPRQREAYAVLTSHNVLTKLEPFTPILVGTIPIAIDIETSDLDIICCWTDRKAFSDAVRAVFGQERAFEIRESAEPGREVVVANFEMDGFAIEIFGQNRPTREQFAYRHMVIEHRLLVERGEEFRQAVIDLKRKGYKTEPAFGQLLGLTDNPYVQLLAYENN